jgi:hypothetical protein
MTNSKSENITFAIIFPVPLNFVEDSTFNRFMRIAQRTQNEISFQNEGLIVFNTKDERLEYLLIKMAEDEEFLVFNSIDNANNCIYNGGEEGLLNGL